MSNSIAKEWLEERLQMMDFPRSLIDEALKRFDILCEQLVGKVVDGSSNPLTAMEIAKNWNDIFVRAKEDSVANPLKPEGEKDEFPRER